MAYQSAVTNGHLSIKKVIPPKTVHLTELYLNADLDLTGLTAVDSGSYYAIQSVTRIINVNLPIAPPHGFMITIANRGTTYEIATMRDGNPIYNIAVGDSLTLVYGNLFGYYFV